MPQEIFKSDRTFILFDIQVSHSQLLLRSQKNSNESCNIDIIFFDTTYIQILNNLKNISIRKLSFNDNRIQYSFVEKYLTHNNNHLFEIQSNKEKYYICASFIKIFENQLEFGETSLGFDNKGREKEIAKSN